MFLELICGDKNKAIVIFLFYIPEAPVITQYRIKAKSILSIHEGFVRLVDGII